MYSEAYQNLCHSLFWSFRVVKGNVRLLGNIWKKKGNSKFWPLCPLGLLIYFKDFSNLADPQWQYLVFNRVCPTKTRVSGLPVTFYMVG